MESENSEKVNISKYIFIPVLLTIIMWAIKFFEWFGEVSFSRFGIYPLKINGLSGILFSPMLHADFQHLINNSIPFLVLTIVLYGFYKPIALRIILLLWLTTGIFVWLGGRHAYHIGASGIIYGLASFLFFTGIFSKNPKLIAISLLVIFLYGSMVWGIFPIYPDISWESHLFGLISGVLYARVYAKDLRPADINDIPDELDDTDPYWELHETEKP